MTTGICNVCGCVIILDAVWERHGCPGCRAARVAEAFRPLDPTRTALGINGRRPLDPEFKQTLRASLQRYRDSLEDLMEESDTSEDREYGIPLGKAAQLCFLRLMFRR